MPTGPRKIETPFGPRVEKVWGALQVLGVSSYLTQTGNQPNDDDLRWQELVDIAVPIGTLVAIPAINYWNLAHGSLSPEMIDPLDDNSLSLWESHDRPYGIGWASVAVVDVNEADESANPPTQTAQLLVKLHLADYNLDDPWFGIVGYSVTFYGHAAPGTGPQRGAPPPVPLRRRVEMKPSKMR